MDKRSQPASDDDSTDRSCSGGSGSVSVEVVWSDPRRLLSAPEAARLEGLVCSFGSHLGALGLLGEVRAEAVGDDRMTRMHARHKGEATTTDVLTFNLSGDPGVLDADIVVCVDEARRQSAQRGHGVAEELMLYIVHGVLHCTGYDDALDEGDFGGLAMHRREDEILSAIGAGVVFASAVRGVAP